MIELTQLQSPPQRLLILDDDAAIGRMIELVAEGLGMEARFTSTPSEFFAATRSWAPTCIALDLVMPEMDGVEVLVKLAELGCSAQVVITSGVGNRVLEAAARSAREHGLRIAAVLPKPFTATMLRQALRGPGDNLDAWSGNAGKTPLAQSSVPVTEADLSDAIASRQLFVVYQPKIECATQKIAGFEALVRWRHPQRGTLAPGQFLELAERGELIDALTNDVLDQALEWFSRNFLARTLQLSVNMSAQTVSRPCVAVKVLGSRLQEGSWADQVANHCRRWGVDPSCLIFELTETSAMQDPVASLDLLTRMRVKGFELSLDDFGTGYSSMVQLVRLPFSEIKVDKSFVMTASSSRESRSVIRSIVELGHSLGLRCTAEGVEDAEALAFLRTVGCDLAQGYYIAPPMGGDEVLDWIGRYESAGRLELPGLPHY
jgi:EAL domain-containing protein (putative c-di-GMP-specific phosphodiesterase class I)/CheY-like chemotaxis protein